MGGMQELALSGCRSMRGAVLRELCNHCTALKVLHFSRSPIRAVHLEATSKLTQLEVLSVTSCARTDTTPMLNVARNCRSLKALVLFDVGPLQDDALQRVVEAQPFLTTLILGPCSHLTEVFVSGIVAKLPALTHLALSGCSLLSDGALLCIAEGLPNLKYLLLTESAGFGDAGIFALECCTQLEQLSLHPVNNATSAGLIALCDYCDSLEYLLLAHCPPVGEDVILQMLRCCMRLKVLMMTHVAPLSEEGLCRILECSDALKCLALLPSPSSTAIDSSMLDSPVVVWRVHANFPDAVVISEWQDFDLVLDVCVPGLEDQPDIRHAVLHGLFAGGRQSYSATDEPTLTARRLVQDLLRRTRHHSCLVQGVGGGNVQRLRLLREALEVELGSEEMHVQSRVLLEAETELEALEASAHDS
jgi:hypothetical protein